MVLLTKVRFFREPWCGMFSTLVVLLPCPVIILALLACQNPKPQAATWAFNTAGPRLRVARSLGNQSRYFAS